MVIVLIRKTHRTKEQLKVNSEQAASLAAPLIRGPAVEIDMDSHWHLMLYINLFCEPNIEISKYKCESR
jgi:hypothetical protein